ncbi:uncharacterized protein LOC123227528 [Mangifera indica]|uniref:uncharacterized protein LOC123227528 n=1 Tax=Mangifera indica TaxID=29780 RepID=UPI001CFAD4C9|nr:uncharacterized protein LOC123227528 [Mangifera indica]
MQNNVFMIASNVLGLSCLQRNLAYNKSAPHCKLLFSCFPLFDFFSIIWCTAIFPFLADSFDTDQSSFPSGYLRNVVISVSMPSDIEEYKKFTDNGFGFQQLNCQIPSALFRIDTLVSWKQWPIRNHSSAKGCISSKHESSGQQFHF